MCTVHSVPTHFRCDLKVLRPGILDFEDEVKSCCSHLLCIIFRKLQCLQKTTSCCGIPSWSNGNVRLMRASPFTYLESISLIVIPSMTSTDSLDIGLTQPFHQLCVRPRFANLKYLMQIWNISCQTLHKTWQLVTILHVKLDRLDNIALWFCR